VFLERYGRCVAVLGVQTFPGSKPRLISVRVGDYRVIYTIEDDVLLVVVVTVRQRRDIYDR
jgi:hypothetical protein